MTEKPTEQNFQAPSFETAEKWYFDLLLRELERRGQGDAATNLRQQLRLSAAETQPQNRGSKLRLKLAHRLTECETRLNAVTGETISWYIDFLSVEGDKSMPGDEALKLATETARPPEGARLVVSGYETMGDRTVFRARWAHFHDDLPVEGDFIEVLINGKNRKLFSCVKSWRQLNLSGTFEEK